MSKRPEIVTGGIEAKQGAVVNSALWAGEDPFPQYLAEIIAAPELYLSDPRLVRVAGSIGALRKAGYPIHPAVLLGDDKDGIVKELAKETPLPLSVANIEAQTICEHSASRRAARVVQGLADGFMEDPAGAPSKAFAAMGEIQAIFDRAAGRRGLSVRSPDEILALPVDPTENLLGDRLLTKGGRLVIAGAGGVGKSRLALLLAASVISGRDFLGIPTHGQGTRWLVLQAENDNVRLKADVTPLCVHFGADWPLVAHCLRIHTVEHVLDSMLSLDDEMTVMAIQRLIDEVSPDVVVWDSLYNFAIGDLNQDQDMAATLREIHRIGCHRNHRRANVILHHATTGKAGMAKAAGLDRSSFGRNSKVLHSWARGQINVAPLNIDDNELLAFVCGKASNGREFPPFAVRFDSKSLIYERDPGIDIREAFANAKRGKSTERSPLSIDELAELAQGKRKSALAKEIVIAECISRRTLEGGVRRAWFLKEGADFAG